MFCQWVSLSGSVFSNNPNIPWVGIPMKCCTGLLNFEILLPYFLCDIWSHFYGPRKLVYKDCQLKCFLTSPWSFDIDLTSLICSSVSSMPYSSHIAMYSLREIVPSPPVSVLSNSSHSAAKYQSLTMKIKKKTLLSTSVLSPVSDIFSNDGHHHDVVKPILQPLKDWWIVTFVVRSLSLSPSLLSQYKLWE